MRSILVGWIGGTGAAVVTIAVLWAIGLWPRDETASFALGMVIGGGFTIAGISVAGRLENK